MAPIDPTKPKPIVRGGYRGIREEIAPPEQTLPGVAPPPNEPPLLEPKEHEDTGLNSANSLVTELAERNRENRELRDRLARLEALATQPKVEQSADDAEALAIGKAIVRRLRAAPLWLLLAGSPGAVALYQSVTAPKPAAVPVVDDVRSTVKALQADASARAQADTKRLEREAVRMRVLTAFACAQGLRARRLDCDALLRDVDFAAQPLNPKSPPTWKTQETWPEP